MYLARRAEPNLISPPGQNPLHEFLYGRDETIGIKWVRREPVGVVAAKHQVAIQRRLIATVIPHGLQCLLDAETPRVSLLPRRKPSVMLRPVGEAALA